MARRVHENKLLALLNKPCADKTWQSLDEVALYEFREDRDGIFSVQFSHDGNTLAVGFGDGAIELISTKDFRVQFEVRRGRYSSFPLLAMRFHPASKDLLYCVTLNGRIITVDVQTGASNLVNEVPGHDMTCLDFSTLGDSYATGGKGAVIKLFDAQSNQEVYSFQGDKQPVIYSDTGETSHAKDVDKNFCLKYHPDQNHVFFTGGWDKTLKIWDSRTQGGMQRSISGPFICGDAIDIKGNDILTGSWTIKDGLKVYDYRSGDVSMTLPFSRSSERGDFIYCAQFAGNRGVMAAGSGTNSLKLIDMDKCKVVSELKLGKPVQAIDHSRTSRQLAVGGMGTVLKFGSLLEGAGDGRDRSGRLQTIVRGPAPSQRSLHSSNSNKMKQPGEKLVPSKSDSKQVSVKQSANKTDPKKGRR